MKKFSSFFTWAILLLSIFFLYSVFSLSPLEINQGYVQKIMYLHVPVIFVSYVAVFIVFLCSIGYLWQASENYDIVAVVCAELGAFFCFLALLSGSIWGKPTWNTYWTWDARIIFTLILFLIFMGYSLIRYLGESERLPKISAMIGIAGFFSVPFNHLAVQWWRTLHQPSTIFSTKNTISPEIKYFLLWSIFYFFLLFFYLFLKRFQLEKKKKDWERAFAIFKKSI